MGKRFEEDQNEIIYKEIISIYARKEGITYTESTRRIDMFVEVLSDFISTFGIIQLRRFGILKASTCKKGKHYNRHTGVTTEIPLRKRFTFSPAKVLRARVNKEIRNTIINNTQNNQDSLL